MNVKCLSSLGRSTMEPDISYCFIRILIENSEIIPLYSSKIQRSTSHEKDSIFSIEILSSQIWDQIMWRKNKSHQRTEVSRGVTFKGAAVEKWVISRLTQNVLFYHFTWRSLLKEILIENSISQFKEEWAREWIFV